MSYNNEFSNLNLMMLEDQVLRNDDLTVIDPVLFRERVAKIIVKAQHKLKFAGISQRERLTLLKVATEGLKAMRDGSHEALVLFYENPYKEAINEGTESDYLVAQDFNYIADDNQDVIIQESEIKESIDQFSAFDPAFQTMKHGAMGNLPTAQESFVSKNKKILIGAGILGIALFLYRSKKKSL